jgi:hypothetical protein
VSAIDAKPKRSGELARVRNIRENPKVSVVIDQYEEEWSRLPLGHHPGHRGDSHRRA